MGQIVLFHEFPPIPDRRWDWCAHGDSYEPGWPIGWGPTKEAAVADYFSELEDEELVEIRFSMITHGDGIEWLQLLDNEQTARAETA